MESLLMVYSHLTVYSFLTVLTVYSFLTPTASAYTHFWQCTHFWHWLPGHVLASDSALISDIDYQGMYSLLHQLSQLFTLCGLVKPDALDPWPNTQSTSFHPAQSIPKPYFCNVHLQMLVVAHTFFILCMRYMACKITHTNWYMSHPPCPPPPCTCLIKTEY